MGRNREGCETYPYRHEILPNGSRPQQKPKLRRPKAIGKASGHKKGGYESLGQSELHRNPR